MRWGYIVKSEIFGPTLEFFWFNFIGDSPTKLGIEMDADVYDEHEKYILNAVNSFKLPASPSVYSNTNDEQESNGGGGLIATAAFGSELAPQVQQLRELRDNKLLNTESGTSFMNTFNQVYYSFSPGIADYERENPIFKEAVKITITPMISSLSILNYVDMSSDQEVLGYGISLILLNIGMYFVAPAVVILEIRKRF